MANRTPGPQAERTGWLRILCLLLALVVAGHNLASVVLYHSVSQSALIWGLATLLAGGAIFFLQPRLGSLFSDTRSRNGGAGSLAPLNAVLAIGALLGASFLVKKTDIAFDGYTAEGGALVLAYNLSRCFLIAAFIAICVGTGVAVKQIASMLAPNRDPGHQPDPGIITLFFIGAAALGIAMLFLGLAGGYHYWIVVVMVLPLYVLGVHRLCLACKSAAGRWSRRTTTLRPAHRLGESIAWGLVLVMALFLLLLKGIFPANDDFDVWVHYLHYYRATVDSGIIAPNDLWYHYWSSKGATLFYMMMAVSDLLAPQLVSYAMILLGSTVVYALMRRLIADRTFSLLAAAAYLQIYVSATDWGYFFKNHEVLAGMLLGAIYLLLRPKGMFERAGLCVIVSYLTVLYPTFSAVIVGGLGVAAIRALLTGKPRNQVWGLIGLGTVSAVTVATLLVQNYLRTGLAMETPIRLWWAHANLEKFSQLYSPHLVDYTLSRIPEAKGAVSFENLLGDNLPFFAKILRLEDLPIPGWVPRWVSGVAFVLALGALLARIGRVGARKKSLILALCILIAISLLAAPVASQPVSVYRVYGFLTFVPILVLGSLGYLILVLACRGVRYRQASGDGAPVRPACNLGVAKTVIAASAAVYLGAMTVEGIANAFTRVPGKSSRQRNLDTLIKYACGWHGPQWAIVGAGLLDEDQLELRRLAGLRNKVVHLNITGHPLSSYPGIGIQSEVSYAMGRHWHEIAFEDADTAKRRLRESGRDYFLLDFREPLFGTLPFSPLFDAADKWKHFNIVGVSGSTLLLTWRTYPQEIEPGLIELWELRTKGNFAEGVFQFPLDIGDELKADEGSLPTDGSMRQDLVKRTIKQTYRDRLNRDFSFESNIHFVDAVLAHFDQALADEDLEQAKLSIQWTIRNAFEAAFKEAWSARYSKPGFVAKPYTRDPVLLDRVTPERQQLYEAGRRAYREKTMRQVPFQVRPAQ